MQKAINIISKTLIPLLIVCACILAVYVVFGDWLPKTAAAIAAIVLFFLCAPIGALWMLYDCSRQPKSSFFLFLLALVPYAFVWYYIDRVLPRSRATRGKLQT